jgi:ornithine cyclodeaminase
MTTLPYLDADAVLALSPRAAVDALEAALRSGFDPTLDPERVAVPTAHGQILMMPSELGPAAGVKLATIAPANPGRGLPRIQGTYVLFDGETLTPVAILDGAALTTVRTPAVSVAAVKSVLLGSDAPLEIVVFGAGPQGAGHVTTLAAVLEGRRPLGAVTYAVRNPGSVDSGLPGDAAVVAAGSAAANEAVRRAGLVVCATTARTPLFGGTEVSDDAVIIAVGSHEPDARELDSTLLGRADVIVEHPATALREAGDVVLAIADGALNAEDLIPMAEVVTGRVTRSGDHPLVFKSTGMSWEDLVIARTIVERRSSGS